MEPFSAALGVLGKVLSLGMKSWDAFRSKGLDKSDLEALEALVDAAKSIGSLVPHAERKGAAAHVGLVTACFGAAFERHWVHTKRFAPSRLKRFFSKVQDQTAKEIELRVKLARLNG